MSRFPSVSAACFTDSVPLSINGDVGVMFSDTESGNFGSPFIHSADKYIVGKGYFETLGIPVMAGQAFSAEDESDNSTSVIVSEELVNRFWKGEDAIGRRIKLSNGAVEAGWGLWPGTFDHRTRGSSSHQVFEAVGVVGNVPRGFGVEKPAPAVYFPLRPADYGHPSFQGITLIVPAAPGPDVVRAVRKEISAMDATIKPFGVRSMVAQVGQTLFAVRAAAWTYGVIGLFGLILSSVGLAGMMAYSVTYRIREIGIRMALGAGKIDVLGLFMKRAGLLIGAGTSIGLLSAWAGMRVLASIFATVARSRAVLSYAPSLLVGAPLLFATVALVTCYLPARRSMEIEPIVALRQE